MKKFMPLCLLALNCEILSLIILCVYMFYGIYKLFEAMADNGNF